LPCWEGRPALEPLSGGLSNTSYLATDRVGRFVVRCGEDIPVHHVSRERERMASVAAHAAGLAPEVLHAEPGLMVLRYVEGRTLGEADLAANIERIVALLQVCHREMPRHLRGEAVTFWVFDVIRDYVRLQGGGERSSAGELARYAALAGALEDTQAP